MGGSYPNVPFLSSTAFPIQDVNRWIDTTHERVAHATTRAYTTRGWWGPGAAARGARVRDQACAVSGACNAWFVASQRSKTVREGRAQCAGCTLLGGVPCGGHVTLACVPAAHQNGVRGYPSLQSVIAHPCMRIGCPCAGLVLRMLVVA